MAEELPVKPFALSFFLGHGCVVSFWPIRLL